MRTKQVVGALELLQGRMAPALDLGDGWLREQSLEPAEERGKVLLLFFAPYGRDGRARGYPFAKELKSMYSEHWDAGLRVAWISFTKGDKDLIEQRRTLGAEARELALNYPVGMDMDPKAPVLVRYSVARGTSTIVAVDRAGRVAWYKMGPTYRDFLLARQVVTRLLREK